MNKETKKPRTICTECIHSLQDDGFKWRCGATRKIKGYNFINGYPIYDGKGVLCKKQNTNGDCDLYKPLYESEKEE